MDHVHVLRMDHKLSTLADTTSLLAWCCVCIADTCDAALVSDLVLCAAVPLTVFALDYCIRYPADSMTDVAAKQLEIVSVDFSDAS